MDTAPAEILWLHQTGPNGSEPLGMKAGRLARLAQAGFPVPPGFCLPAAAYRRHVLEADPAYLRALLENGDYPRLRAWIAEREIEPGDRAALLTAYHRLLPQAARGVAVRSSSSAEDLDGRSFAGLYTSVLNVTGDEQILDAVRACWASCWNDEAVAYLRQAGLDPAGQHMAVLVQAMVPAVLSGVIFTRAAGLEPDLALIEFTHGAGEALMNGQARAVSLLVDRRTGRPVHAGQAERELDVSRLLALALPLEDLMDAPQDVEWAMDASGALWILQSRPVTGSPAGGLGPASGDGWQLTYDEPFSPLGVEIAEERYRYWVAGINASFKTRFAAEMRAVDGLLYYRPAWRSAGPLVSAWMNLWRLAAWLRSGSILRQYVERILPDYTRRLAAIEQAPLTEQNNAALLEDLRAAVRAYLDFQFTSYAIGAAATLSAGLLGYACRRLFGSRAGWDALDFLTGLDDVSIQRELEVYHLGQRLRPYLPPCAASLAELWEQVDPAGPFWAALQRFLRAYGYLWADRYPRDPAWELNQEALTTSLWIAAQAAPEESLVVRHRQQQTRRAAAVQQALAALSQPGSLPLRRWAFSLLLRRAETLFPFKENRNHATYQGMMVIRRVAREIGRRMQARNILPAAEDLFFLELGEIETLWNNPRAIDWLREALAQRKARYHRSRQRAHRRAERANGQASPAAEAIEVRGDPCSPGLAQGPARLISGPGELQRVRPGEIVVCSQLRPAWSAVFARAGGVVIEMGSLLSHGSTLAREYGIPAVINIADITRLVSENDWLVVDGNLGRVSIERQPAPLAAEAER